MSSQPPPPKARSRPPPKPAQLKRANEEIDRVLGELAKPEKLEKREREEKASDNAPD